MGRRSEQRIAVSLPVTVRGLDPRGNPFTITTKTNDISFSGASLDGLSEVVEPGAKIEVESQGRRAWYRVRWIGENGGPRAGRVGLRSLERGRYIWGVAPKGWEPDTHDPSRSPQEEASLGSVSAAFGSWTGPERRQFARHACRFEAQATDEEGSVTMPGKITDVSLGGCYFETLSPFPAETPVQLSFKLDDAAMDLSGRVCSSQLGTGMRIEFTAMSPAEFEALRRFAPPAAPPAKSSSPVAATSSEALDAVVHLLVLKGLLTAEELSEEIERVKSRRVVIPA